MVLVAAVSPLLASPSFTEKSLEDSQSRSETQITARVEVVNVGVTVTDGQGRFAENLKRENFRISDNGAEQTITNFASVEEPAQVLVMLETGPSVYFLEREHLQAAYTLLHGLARDDRIALAGYDQSAHALVNFTSDKRVVGDAIAGIRYNLGMAQLNLFDSLDTVLGWLAILPGKKAIVLLSTGLDTSENGSWQKLEAKLRAGEVIVLPIALGAELRTPAPVTGKKKKTAAPAPNPGMLAAFEEADRTLKEIAASTGGQMFSPRKPGDFAGVFSQVAALLRHQYSLGFRPQHDGQVHKIEVRVVEASGQPMRDAKQQPIYRVSHRQAYLAPSAP